MFRLYQATQARMNDGLVKSLDNRVFLLIEFACCEILLLSLILIVWLVRAKHLNYGFA